MADARGFRVALVQSRLASRLTAGAGVRVLPCPFDAAPLIEALWWHPMNQFDAAHVWLRKMLVEACRSLPALDISPVDSAAQPN